MLKTLAPVSVRTTRNSFPAFRQGWDDAWRECAGKAPVHFVGWTAPPAEYLDGRATAALLAQALGVGHALA